MQYILTKEELEQIKNSQFALGRIEALNLIFELVRAKSDKDVREILSRYGGWYWQEKIGNPLLTILGCLEHYRELRMRGEQ